MKIKYEIDTPLEGKYEAEIVKFMLKFCAFKKR